MAFAPLSLLLVYQTKNFQPGTRNYRQSQILHINKNASNHSRVCLLLNCSHDKIFIAS